jgi:hypothetical protein
MKGFGYFMHCIRGFIGKEELIRAFSSSWVKANIIVLLQGFSMIFLTDDLYDDIVELFDSRLETDYSKFFDYLSPSIYEVLEQESRKGKLAYFETDYFGGVGSQSAILFEKGKLIIQPLKTETCWDEKNNNYFHKPAGESAINTVLQELGVYKENGMDEFDSIRLGNYRRMDR